MRFIPQEIDSELFIKLNSTWDSIPITFYWMFVHRSLLSGSYLLSKGSYEYFKLKIFQQFIPIYWFLHFINDYETMEERA